jgi:hypothetical protein
MKIFPVATARESLDRYSVTSLPWEGQEYRKENSPSSVRNTLKALKKESGLFLKIYLMISSPIWGASKI